MKTLIMLMSFVEQVHGWPTWSFRATWSLQAQRWWPLQ